MKTQPRSGARRLFAPHFTRITDLDLAGFLFLISALAAAMLADVVDRLLIVTLGTHAISLPLNALWFSWMAQYQAVSWAPRPPTCSSTAWYST